MWEAVPKKGLPTELARFGLDDLYGSLPSWDILGFWDSVLWSFCPFEFCLGSLEISSVTSIDLNKHILSSNQKWHLGNTWYHHKISWFSVNWSPKCGITEGKKWSNSTAVHAKNFIFPSFLSRYLTWECSHLPCPHFHRTLFPTAPGLALWAAVGEGVSGPELEIKNSVIKEPISDHWVPPLPTHCQTLH